MSSREPVLASYPAERKPADARLLDWTHRPERDTWRGLDAQVPLHPSIARGHRGASVRLGVVEALFAGCPSFVATRALGTGLRLAGVRMGRTSQFWGMPTLAGEGDICSRLEIGEACGFNFGCYFELAGRISFADHVSVGHQVMFLTRTHDATNPERRGDPSGALPIRVEPGAWIGARCTIMPGVTIGAGAVVGASVVVREDVPANTLFTGTRKISIAKWR